jgi:hypothetical protein
MKVLFLDIDGVLNSTDFLQRKAARNGGRVIGTDHIDPDAVSRLNTIIAMTDCKVVVSSVWRFNKTPDELYLHLRKHGFVGEVIGSTPQNAKKGYERGHEIQEWLDTVGQQFEEPVECFVILDDDSDMVHLLHRLVKTKFANGLQDEHVAKAIALLSEEAVRPTSPEE